MAHMMKSMRKSISKQVKNLGEQFESAGHEPRPSPESRAEKSFRKYRGDMDKAEKAVSDAKTAKTLKAAMAKMAVAQTHLSAAYKACEKAK